MTPAVEVRDLFRVHQTPEGDAAALQGLRQTLGFPQLPHERRPDHVRTGGNRNPYLQPGVASKLHVRFPFRIAGEVRLAVARVACRGGSALRLAAD